MSFTDQIKSSNTSLNCLVRFFTSLPIANPSITNPDDVVQVSLKDISNTPIETYPFLKSFPSIKESLNIETKKYSISSVKLSIHNGDIGNNQIFSDLLDTEHFRINKVVQIIYYANNLIDENYLAYQGKIKYSYHNQDTVTIELEDSTQDSLFKDVPVKYTPNDDTLLEKSRNIPYPMVYGSIDKSPCIFMSYVNESQNYTLSPSLVMDSPDRNFGSGYNLFISERNIGNGVEAIRSSNIYIGVDGSYIELSRFSEDFKNAYEVGSDYDNLLISENTNTYVDFRTSNENDITKNAVLRGYLVRNPKNIELNSSMPEHALTQQVKFNSSFSLAQPNTSLNGFGQDTINYENVWLRDDVNSEILAQRMNANHKLYLSCPPDVADAQLSDPARSIQRISTELNANDDEYRHEKYQIKASYAISNIGFKCSTYLLAGIYLDANENENFLHLDFYDPDYNRNDNPILDSQKYRATGYINISVAGDCPTIHSDLDGGGFWSADEFGAGYGSTTGRFVEDAVPFNFIQDADINPSSFGDSVIEYIYPLDLLQNYLSADGDSAPNNPLIHNQSSWSGVIGSSDNTISGEPSPISGTATFNFNTWNTFGSLLNPEHGVSKSDTWTNVNQYDNLTVTLNPQIRKSIRNENGRLGFFGWDEFSITGLSLFHNVFIDKYWNQDFYVDINGGRASQYLPSAFCSYPSVEQIINDIVGIELNNPSVVNSDFSGIEEDCFNGETLRYAFCQKDRINSKKLIEELASFSALFPIFKDNKLNYKFIKSTYNPSAPEHKKINSLDVINYSFTRTDVRELYSEIIFNFDYDHSLDKYRNSHNLLTHNLLTTYDYNQYKTGNLQKIIDCKYISDSSTALKIAKYILLNNCNPHNIIKITLPLNYIDFELGDVVKFNSLINNQKMYGEDYTLSIYEKNGQQKYGLFFVKSISKKQNNIELELYQLHNLSGSVPVIEYCPLPNYENYDPNSTEGLLNGTYYQPNPDICEGLIEEEEPPPPPIYGCNDSNALNWDSQSNIDDGSCFYFWDENWIGGFTSTGLQSFHETLGSWSTYIDHGNVDHIAYFIGNITGDNITFKSSDDTSNIELNIDEFDSAINVIIALPKSFNPESLTPVENSWNDICIYTKNNDDNVVKKVVVTYEHLKTLTGQIDSQELLDDQSDNAEIVATEIGNNFENIDASYLVLAKMIEPNGQRTLQWYLTVNIPIYPIGEQPQDYLYFKSGYTVEGGTEIVPSEEIDYTYNFYFNPYYNSGAFNPYDNTSFSIVDTLGLGYDPFYVPPPFRDAIHLFGKLSHAKDEFGLDIFKEKLRPHYTFIAGNALDESFYEENNLTPPPRYINFVTMKTWFERDNQIFSTPFISIPNITNPEFDNQLDHIVENQLLPQDIPDYIDNENIMTGLINSFLNNQEGITFERRQFYYILIGSTIDDSYFKLSSNPNDLNYAEFIIEESSSYSNNPLWLGDSEFSDDIVDTYMYDYPLIKNLKEWKSYIAQCSTAMGIEIRLIRYENDSLLTSDDFDDEHGNLKPSSANYVNFSIDTNNSTTNFNFTNADYLQQESNVKFIDFRDISNIFGNEKNKIRIQFYNYSDTAYKDYFYIEIKRKSDVLPSPFTRYRVSKNQCSPTTIRTVNVFNGLYSYSFRYESLDALYFGQHPFFGAIPSTTDPDGGEDFGIAGYLNGQPLRHTLSQVSQIRLFSNMNNVYDNNIQNFNPSDCNVGYITEYEEVPLPEQEVEVTNNVGVICRNFKEIENITGSANTELTYHNEIYCIGNPANELIYNINNQDEEDVEFGEDLVNQDYDNIIEDCLESGRAKEFKIRLQSGSGEDNDLGGGAEE